VGGYRDASAPEAEPPDAELVCATELHRRADRIRRVILVPGLLSGIALGVVGYLALRELFFATLRAHQPYVTGLLTILPAFVGSLRAARWISDTVVGARVDGWSNELAKQHGVSAEALADHVRLVRGRE
jgi:hypothetical protein